MPAGGALAVDREVFSSHVTSTIKGHPGIELCHEVVETIPPQRPVILATGPLTGEALASDLARAIGEDQLAYYDAIAPIVSAESIDWDKVFRASRYDKGGDDAYLNCPMTEAEYHAFVQAICEADKVQAHAFENARHFEGCLPVEVMAGRGRETLAHGPMKPVGLVDPRTGQRPYAVVQLRQENKDATAWNLVGFQTRMTFPEQKRVFRMIPGLENATFERFGTVHRNTFVHGPAVLDEMLSLRALPGVHLAGQITGVEGYVESAACGLTLGLLLADRLAGRDVLPPPETTALGALLRHVTRPHPDYQPSNIIWGMFPALAGKKLRKRQRREAMAERALRDLNAWLSRMGITPRETFSSTGSPIAGATPA